MNKTKIKKLEKELKFKSALVWDKLKPQERKASLKLSEDYKAFLNTAKTEREAVKEIEARAKAAGFRPISSRKTKGRVYASFMDKTMALAVPGQKPLTEGLRLIVSHIDAPRLDLKQHPVYEDVDLVLFKTHYYGGIKKHQWLSRPLALHGRVIKADGSVLDLVLGEDENDPVLTIADLLPHLAGKVQAGKKVSEAFPGEKLNLLAGSLPLGDDEVKERFKLAVLELLRRRWGLIEEDFLSAEFEAVPAGRARDVGLDSSMIGSYGQDDRICAFTSLAALLDAKRPVYTCLALFMDKEEIGSDGATGAKSRFLEDFLSDLFVLSGKTPSSAALRKTLMNTRAISADVTGAIDPDYQEVHEKLNAARLGYGPCVSKYTGSGGKYSASDASAEYLGWIRQVLNRARIVWQAGELGRVDEGGGGTVAKFLAEHGMEIVDFGPPLLDMHSPFEISSKADVYMTRQAYQAFYLAR
ncbi:MAG: aminopeptidase [Deltaproteobacteria bacterium]|nr:aminopeptidase [Deltaproteobacteria bacterium]